MDAHAQVEVETSKRKVEVTSFRYFVVSLRYFVVSLRYFARNNEKTKWPLWNTMMVYDGGHLRTSLFHAQSCEAKSRSCDTRLRPWN